LLEHRETDFYWVKLARVNGQLFRIDRWWPDSERVGAP